MRDLGKNLDPEKHASWKTAAPSIQSEVQTHDFLGREPHEVQEFLAKVYAENKFRSAGKRRRVLTKIRTAACADIALCNVNHAAPFSFESTTPRHSFLILSCTGGFGTLQADDASVPVFRRSSVPLSATGVVGISGEPALTHFSIHINAEKVNSLCAQWIGSKLAQPLLLHLKPFASELTLHWQQIIKATDALMGMKEPPPIALISLREHAIGLLLEHHPHNYSRFLRGHRTAPARVIREAARIMEDQARLPITIGEIADVLGCSIQSLHQGFREHERTTPRAFLYATRLKRVRDALIGGSIANSAADAASQYGFVNYERFSAAYAERYGEHRNDTFRRYDSACNRDEGDEPTTSGPSLTEAKAEMLREYIDTHSDDRIFVGVLAQKSGMSIQNFIVAFSKAFGTTPARYVIAERLRRACWLLSNSKESISVIAAETGFASQSHLTTTLKQHKGVTPLHYRRSFAKIEKTSRIF